MNRFVLGTVGLIALGVGGNSAMAADMPIYKAAPLPVWTWAGVYFGAHAGGAWGKSSWTSDVPCGVAPGTATLVLCDPVNQKPGGWVVGGQAGARWQWGAWVFGVEGTLAASRIIANDPTTCTGAGVPNAACLGGVFNNTHHETLLGTLYTGTAQLGYAFNRTLFYVKGGWAGSEVRRNSEVLTATGGAGTVGGETRQATGWTVGTGIEYLVLQNLSLGVEYDYFRLNASAYSNVISRTAAGAAGFVVNATDASLHVHQVVARANYRLDWGILWGGPAPVAARY